MGEPTGAAQSHKQSHENLSDEKDNTSLLNVDSVETNLRKPKEEEAEFEPPEGGWGWVVCFASFWTNGTLFGILNTFGILYVKILEEFKDPNSDADIAFKCSWIGALQIALTFFLSPIASMLVDRIGIRLTSFCGAIVATIGMVSSSFVTQVELLYLTYGVFLGAGSSFVYTPSMVILGHYFKKRLGIVNGFVSFGSAVFTFVLPLLMKYTLEEVGLRWTMRIVSIFFALLIPCALCWKPLYNPRHKELDHYLTSKESIVKRVQGCGAFCKKFFNVEIWRNRGYRIWVTGLPISFLGYFVPFVHLVKHANDVMPNASAEILVICLGATSGVSRLICGKLADIEGINRVRMQQFAFFILGVSTACIPFATNFYVLVVIVLIMGICDGCFVCLLGPIAFDLLGPTGAAQGLGCLLGLMSIPMTVGPPMAGLAYDYMKSYKIAFLAAGAPPIIGACVLFLMPYDIQVVPHVQEAESIAAMSHENLDRTGMGSNADLFANRRIVSLRNIPIAVSSDFLPSTPSHSRKVQPRPPHHHRPSYLNEDLTNSVPNLSGKLKTENKRTTEFSSIPMLHKA